MPDRLMAGQRPLKPSILVRIQVGHQIKKPPTGGFLLDAWLVRDSNQLL